MAAADGASGIAPDGTLGPALYPGDQPPTSSPTATATCSTRRPTGWRRGRPGDHRRRGAGADDERAQRRLFERARRSASRPTASPRSRSRSSISTAMCWRRRAPPMRRSSAPTCRGRRRAPRCSSRAPTRRRRSTRSPRRPAPRPGRSRDYISRSQSLDRHRRVFADGIAWSEVGDRRYRAAVLSRRHRRQRRRAR